ncbi:hypothetical protein Tco_0710890 [Tanacetum coccineum]
METKDTLSSCLYSDEQDMQHMLKTIIHAQTIQKRLDDKKLQIQECTVQEVKALDVISEDKAKQSCMESFQKLHSHLKHLSHDNLKGTRIESGFKRAFATLFFSIIQIQTTEGKVDTGKAVDANIRPFDEEPMVVVSTEVHQAAETVTKSNELDLLFSPLFDEYFNAENQVVLKSSAVTTTDASNKRQQQPDSTSSTSTLATTVTANGNVNL